MTGTPMLSQKLIEGPKKTVGGYQKQIVGLGIANHIPKPACAALTAFARIRFRF
jgi:hypothetical protein